MDGDLWPSERAWYRCTHAFTAALRHAPSPLLRTRVPSSIPFPRVVCWRRTCAEFPGLATKNLCGRAGLFHTGFINVISLPYYRVLCIRDWRLVCTPRAVHFATPY
jgi:hypothetical protein